MLKILPKTSFQPLMKFASRLAELVDESDLFFPGEAVGELAVKAFEEDRDGTVQALKELAREIKTSGDLPGKWRDFIESAEAKTTNVIPGNIGALNARLVDSERTLEENEGGAVLRFLKYITGLKSRGYSFHRDKGLARALSDALAA